MEFLICLYIFIFGITLGSFYNVVGYRLPRGESLVKPRSHCPNCQHVLTPLELIPIFSYLFQGAKCKNCKQKIAPFYMLFELLTGILFVVSYLVFGFSIEFFIAISFVSMSIIIMISDSQTYIISDEVLIFFSIIILILNYFNYNFNDFIYYLLSGVGAFVTMYVIKKIADFAFKKEAMGGGDIKLMFVFGLVIGYAMSIFSIFVASLVGLPISLLILKYKKTNIIPFGPFLCIGALLIMFLNIDMTLIFELIR